VLVRSAVDDAVCVCSDVWLAEAVVERVTVSVGTAERELDNVMGLVSDSVIDMEWDFDLLGTFDTVSDPVGDAELDCVSDTDIVRSSVELWVALLGKVIVKLVDCSIDAVAVVEYDISDEFDGVRNVGVRVLSSESVGLRSLVKVRERLRAPCDNERVTVWVGVAEGE